MPALSTRQERRKQRTRRRLLDAARRVIARLGYDATGVLDITEEADVSKGTFYQYFRDKEELTHTLILEGFGELRACLDQVLTGERRLGLIEQALHIVFQYAADNRDLFRIMLGRQASAELNMTAFNYFSEVVEDTLTRSGVVPDAIPFPPALLAQFIAGACVRLGLWWIEDDRGLSPAEISRLTYRMLSEGVLSLLPPELQPQDGVE